MMKLKAMSSLSFTMGLLLFSVFFSSVWAGDEEMMSPYHRFDPETGFFIPIDEQEPDAQDSPQLVIPESGTSSKRIEQSDSESSVISGTGIYGTVLAGAAATLFLVMGAIFWYRKGRHHTL